MKKLFLTSIALIFVTALFAQEGTTNLGFNVGFAEPVMYYRASSSAAKLTRQATDGIKLGVIYETNIIKGFGVSSSLNYTHSTHIGPWTVTPGFAARKTKEDHNFHQLEIPVDWQYKFVIAKYTYLGLYTGPTLQVGLANTFRYRTKVGDEIIEVSSSTSAISSAAVTTLASCLSIRTISSTPVLRPAGIARAVWTSGRSSWVSTSGSSIDGSRVKVTG